MIGPLKYDRLIVKRDQVRVDFIFARLVAPSPSRCRDRQDQNRDRQRCDNRRASHHFSANSKSWRALPLAKPAPSYTAAAPYPAATLATSFHVEIGPR